MGELHAHDLTVFFLGPAVLPTAARAPGELARRLGVGALDRPGSPGHGETGQHRRVDSRRRGAVEGIGAGPET